MIANAEDPFLWQTPSACPRGERRRILGGQLDLLPSRLKAEIIDRLRRLLDHHSPLVRLGACEVFVAIRERQLKLCRMLLELVKRASIDDADGEQEGKPRRQRQPAVPRDAA